MIPYTFNVSLYDFKISLIQIESSEDIDLVKKELLRLEVDEEDMEDILEIIENESQNGGNVLGNMKTKELLVIFYPQSSSEMTNKIFGQKKRQVEDRILEWCDIQDKEAAAFLAGYLSQQFDGFKSMCNRLKNEK